jgi:hypothetical protein
VRLARSEWLSLLAGVAIYLGLTLHCAFTHTTTYDEASHLPAGYTYLTTGDFRLNPEHPPLAKMVAAAPLLLISPVVHLDDRAWTEARQWQFGRRFLYRWNDARRVLRLGRSAVAVLGFALVVAVFFVARSRYGAGAGRLALALAAFSPELIAHGGLVTTDVPLALFVFLSVVAFDRLLARLAWMRLAMAGTALGAALGSKFTAPALVAVFALMAASRAMGSRPMAVDLRGSARAVSGRLGRLMAGAAALAAVTAWALVVLWACYGFRYSMTLDEGVMRAWKDSAAASSSLAPAPLRVVASLGIVPEAYSEGLAFAWRHARGRASFLLGQVSEQGFPHFFVVSFLVKTPLPLLILLGVALAVSWRAGSLVDSIVWWIPVIVWFGLTFTRGLNIGHRHLLPIYPFLILVAAQSALVPWARVRLAVGGLVLWYVAGTILVHPHEIAYFNETVGGARNGWKVLVDSSLDWGQDLDRLREQLRARGVEKVRLSYFGSADPAWHGIRGELLPSVMSPRPTHVTRRIEPGDILAVSATNLQGVYLQGEERALMARLRGETPVGRVGQSIFLFRATFQWEPDAKSAPLPEGASEAEDGAEDQSVGPSDDEGNR